MEPTLALISQHFLLTSTDLGEADSEDSVALGNAFNAPRPSGGTVYVLISNIFIPLPDADLVM